MFYYWWNSGISNNSYCSDGIDQNGRSQQQETSKEVFKNNWVSIIVIIVETGDSLVQSTMCVQPGAKSESCLNLLSRYCKAKRNYSEILLFRTNKSGWISQARWLDLRVIFLMYTESICVAAVPELLAHEVVAI